MNAIAMWFGVILACLLIASSSSLPQPSHNLEKRNAPCKVCKQKPLDIAFIIDSSSSVWPENFTLGLWFVQDFVDIYDISPTKVRVAAVTFGDRVYTEQAFHFGDYTEKEALKKAITDLEFMAGLATETGEAIKFYRENLKPEGRDGVKQICVVLTDGNSQDTQKTADEAQLTREEGIEMFAIGVGHSVSETELRNIAGTDNNVMSVSNYDLLRTVKSRLAYKACGSNPIPEVVCRDNPIDISFVVDSSSSIDPNDFQLGQDFLKEFVQTFHVAPDNTRISLITFGNGVYEEDAFDFDTYDEEEDVVNAIRDVPFRAGNYTSTGAGIKYMLDKQMAKARPGVARIAIVLTDGQSQEWQNTYDEAKFAQAAGVSMFAIGVGKVGKQLSMEELEKIAGNSDHVFVAADYNALNTIKFELDSKTCMSVLHTFGQIPL
ncbi:cartilage matrix protein-like [Gigantopelta aegis]|uniref:cartilage matrix protein-like n=1 Tax=Gigantopelta aegis TaxID=1735272 RepID=UPI001B888E87|nr:cartilage matrix protein-like [Gigantopelta aegis]